MANKHKSVDVLGGYPEPSVEFHLRRWAEEERRNRIALRRLFWIGFLLLVTISFWLGWLAGRG